MRTEVIASKEELVSMVLVKKHLRLDVDSNEEDVLLDVAIASAISQVENYIERIVKFQQTIIKTKSKNSFIVECSSLVDVVEKVEIQEEGVDSIFLPESSFKQIKRGTETYEVVLVDVPDLVGGQEYAIYVDQGYDSESLPKPILSAILLFIGDAYEKREDRGQYVNTAAHNLLRPYRKWR